MKHKDCCTENKEAEITNIETAIKQLRVIYAYFAFAYERGTTFFNQQELCDIKERANKILELLNCCITK